MNQSVILFIINLKSGNTDKSALKIAITHFCSKYNREYSILHLSEEINKEKINQKIIDEKPELVVACGGDGTINLLAEILQGRDIKLGIVPLGSANGLANELDIPEDIEESLEIIFTGKTEKIDVVVINDQHISLHLSDVGFNAKMIQDFEKRGERGKLAYVRSFFNSLMEKEPTDFTIELNEESFDVKAEMIVFANASSYGTGAIINPKSSMNDGSFEVIVFKPIPLTELPSLTFSSFLGDIEDSPYVAIYKTQSARIICHQKQLLQVDGELRGKVDEVKVEIKRRAIEIVVP